MLPSPEQRSRISRVSQVITIVTLHVHGLAAQVPVCNQCPEPPGSVAELEVMACGKLEPFFLGQVHKLLSLPCVNGKWLLDIHVAAVLKANPSNIKVTLRRRRNMDDVGPGLGQKFNQIAEVPFDRESIAELLGHQRFAVTHSHDLAIADPQYLRGMRVSDLPASNDADLKHAARLPRSC